MKHTPLEIHRQIDWKFLKRCGLEADSCPELAPAFIRWMRLYLDAARSRELMLMRLADAMLRYWVEEVAKWPVPTEDDDVPVARTNYSCFRGRIHEMGFPVRRKTA